MKDKLKLILGFFFLQVAIVRSTQAQYAFSEKGSVFFEKEDANTISGIAANKVKGLMNNISKIKGIILRTSLLDPPEGFHVYTGFFIDQAENYDLPWLNATQANISFDLSPLYFDKKRLLDARDAASEVLVDINDFRKFIKSPYSTPLAEVNNPEPVFFRLDGVKVDSSDKRDILVTFSGGQSIHVITNGKRFLVPFTQGQYMHFKIARDQKVLRASEKEYNDQEQKLQSIKKELLDISKKPPVTDYEKNRFNADKNSIKLMEEIADADKKALTTLRDRLKRDQDRLRQMKPEMPAYINLQIPSTLNDDLICPDIADRNDPGKQELWTIDPGYFNKSLPATVIQLMIVSFYYHPQMTAEHMKVMAENLFKAIDYEKLEGLVAE